MTAVSRYGASGPASVRLTGHSVEFRQRTILIYAALPDRATAGGWMLDLNDFYYFVQVVDRGGFTAACAAHSQVDTQSSLKEIESNLGVRPNSSSRSRHSEEADSRVIKQSKAMTDNSWSACRIGVRRCKR